MQIGQPHVRWMIRSVLILLIITAVTLVVFAYHRQQPEYLAARASEAIKVGDDERAEIYLWNLIRKVPQDADAKLTLADLLVRRAGGAKSYAVDHRAMQLLAAAAGQKPDDLALQAKLMMAYVDSGRDEAALGIARKLVRAKAPSETALYLVARKAVADGNYLEAEEPLARLAALQPDPPLRVLVLQAHVWSQQRENARLGQLIERVAQKATALAADIAKLPPPDRRALQAILTLGIQRAEGPEQAQRRTEQALTLLESISRTADTKDKLAAIETAAGLVLLLVETHPLKPPLTPGVLEDRRRLLARFASLARPVMDGGQIAPLIYYLVAEAELVQGNAPTAIEILETGLAQGEKLPAARAKELAPLHLLVAQSLVAQRRFDETQPHWKWLLKDHATAAWGRRLAGAIALEEGRLEEAASQLAAALPGFADAMELHAALAATYLRLGRWERAVEPLKVVLARRDRLNNEERAVVARYLGGVHNVPVLLGNAQLALKHYTDVPPLIETLLAGGQEPAALGLLVAYDVARGEREEALRQSREARAKYPNDFGLALQEVGLLKTASERREAVRSLQHFAEEGDQHLAAGAVLVQWWVANGDRDAAMALTDAMLKRFPDDLGVKLLRTNVRLAADKLDEAQPMIEELRHAGAQRETVNLLQIQAALLDNRLDDAAAALADMGDQFRQSGLSSLWSGQLALAQGDIRHAVSELLAAFRINSLRPAAREGLVQALSMLLVQKDFATAETSLNELLAASPDEPRLLLLAADLAFQQGRFERVMPLLDKTEKLQPNLLLIVQAKARAWLKQGRADLALKEVHRALRANPLDVSTRLLAAETHLARDDYNAALAQLDEVPADDARLADAQLLRAETLRRMKRPEEAIAQLEDLVARQPNVLLAYPLLAEIYRSQSNGAKALDILRSARERFPGEPALGVKEIGVLCGLGRASEAEQVARKMAGEKPDADLCLALSAVFLEAHEMTVAWGWAEQALALGDAPRQTAARLLLANASLVEGLRNKDQAKLAAARDYYRQVFETQPENLLAANNLAWLLSSQFREPDKAREVVDQVLRKTSLKNLPAGVADTFAMVYRETHQVDAAQQIVENALQRAPDSAVLNFQAGLVYVQKGRIDPARAALQKAIDVGLPAEQAAEATAELQRLEATAEQQPTESPAENGAAPG